MSVLSKLASAQGRKDDNPNKDLGRELAENHDTAGIRIIAENLVSKDKRIRADCLSVLEQVGLLAPALLVDYASEFLALIFSNENRMVWAAMINLALIADRVPIEIFKRYPDIVKVIEQGSVITKDNGIKTLAKVAAEDSKYKGVIIPFLLDQLKGCRSKSVPQYAESIRCALDPDNQSQFLDILNERFDTLSTAQQKRVGKLIRTF